MGASNSFYPALLKFLFVVGGILKIIWLWIVGSFIAILPSNVLPQKSIENEVVLLTGSGGGLGRELAKRLAQRGARLILWDLNEKANEETKKLVEMEGAEAHTFKVDISKREEIYEAGKKSLQIYGRVDILLNNAGIVNSKKFWECSDDLMEKVVAVNCTLAKVFVPGMIERNHGHVVVVSSMAGKVGIKGLVDYCASKFGAVGFTEALAAELRNTAKNVNVTLACPYYLNTGMFNGVKPSSSLVLPILEVDYVADRIIEAMVTNQGALYLPRFSYIPAFLKEILPSPAGVHIAHVVGVDKELDSFLKA